MFYQYIPCFICRVSITIIQNRLNSFSGYLIYCSHNFPISHDYSREVSTQEKLANTMISEERSAALVAAHGKACKRHLDAYEAFLAAQQIDHELVAKRKKEIKVKTNMLSSNWFNKIIIDFELKYVFGINNLLQRKLKFLVCCKTANCWEFYY